ncbi:MAG: cyclic-di-AMP receptor [Lachnospiraceae bacterium]
MKLIVAIISPDDVASVIKHLTKQGYSSTKLTSTGGLLKEGNVTIIVGIEAENLEVALAIIDKYSHSRVRLIQTPSLDGVDSPPTEVKVGGATVFVLDCEQFMRF